MAAQTDITFRPKETGWSPCPANQIGVAATFAILNRCATYSDNRLSFSLLPLGEGLGMRVYGAILFLISIVREWHSTTKVLNWSSQSKPSPQPSPSGRGKGSQD